MRHNVQWWRRRRSAPKAPASLTATSVAATEVVMVWTDDPNANSFALQRSTTATTGFTTIYTGAAATYTDSGLTEGSTYYYRVRASNGFGVSGWSPTLTVNTTAVSNPPPTPTSGPVVDLAGTTAIDLSMPAVTGATRYVLQREVTQ